MRELAGYRLTPHAEEQIIRRGLDLEVVRQVLISPEQNVQTSPGRSVLQSRFPIGPSGKLYLVRVVADVDRTPAEVVTVYATGKIDKYWKE
ncbi:MAG: DUF4258 domain-containing protein [Gemmatimonadota bacterium]